MTERVLATFDTAREASEAAEELRFAEPGSAVSLLSAEPIHSEIESVSRQRKSRIGLFAIAGGVLGAVAAVLLTVLGIALAFAPADVPGLTVPGSSDAPAMEEMAWKRTQAGS